MSRSPVNKGSGRMRHIAALTILMALVACGSGPTQPSRDAAFSSPVPGDVFSQSDVVTIRWRSTSLDSVGIIAQRVAGGPGITYEIVCRAPSEPTGGSWPWDLSDVGPGVYELTLLGGGHPCAASPKSSAVYHKIRIFVVAR